jgi:hypothetical protein
MMVQCKRKEIARLRDLPANSNLRTSRRPPETMHKFDAAWRLFRSTFKQERAIRSKARHFFCVFHAPYHRLVKFSQNDVPRRSASLACRGSARGNGIAQGIHTSPDSIHPLHQNGSN